MSPVFLVILEDLDGERAMTICEGKKALAHLMSNLSNNFEVKSVDCVKNFIDDYKEFCFTSKDLEFGDHEKN